MFTKAMFIVCAQAFFIQIISTQCYGSAYPAFAASPYGAAYGVGLGYPGLGCGAIEFSPAPCGLAASNGAGLAIASASSLPPVGVSVASENAIEGALAVAGALPFLGTVALEGVLPTAGAGAVSYNCGSGIVAITAEDIVGAPIGINGPLGLGTPLGIGIGSPVGLANNIGLGLGPVVAAAPYAATPYATGLGYPGLGYGAIDITPNPCGLVASNGAGLAIASASPISPVGVSVASENGIEGALAVAGAVPFLGTVGLEGVLPTAGAGAVSYNCGSGLVGITAEDIGAAPLGIAGPLRSGALGLPGNLGFGAPFSYAGGPIGLAGSLGCGYGIL